MSGLTWRSHPIVLARTVQRSYGGILRTLREACGEFCDLVRLPLRMVTRRVLTPRSESFPCRFGADEVDRLNKCIQPTPSLVLTKCRCGSRDKI